MDSVVNFTRWSAACMAVTVSPDEGEYRRVRRAWRGLSRHYHTLEHLEACLRELDSVRELALRPAEVELALWFHDVVYKTWRHDNEQQSAEWAARALRAAPDDCVSRIRQMILATTHADEALGGDTALMADVDLSILGQPPEIYARFERAVRREYWWVPRARYVAARRKVLEGFLGRSTIYQHDALHRKYEAQARANIAGALAQLAWK
jgi:predicted metal-dependent HD superfamily phosphohydrolase